jgi:D-threo-aldose 1-dehydrogenase
MSSWLMKLAPRIGASTVEPGPIGLGAAPLGNLFSEVTEADAEATLSAAERQGIRWFDVAPFYGYGMAEERLGRYLQRRSHLRPIISTKAGRVLEPSAAAAAPTHFVAPPKFRPVFDYSRKGIEQSYSDSLRRLGLDRVQMLLLHDIDRLTHPTRHRSLVKQLFDEALPTLRQIKAEGRVDAIGLGINEWDIGYEILASVSIDCVLLAGRYTLLDQSALSSGFLDACARQNVSVLAGGVFNSGFLAGGAHYDYLPAGDELVARRDGLLKLCRRFDVPLLAAAVQFTAAHPAIVSVVVGARSPQEVDSILEGTRAPIPAEFWNALREAGVIPGDAPTPNVIEGGK